MNNEFFEKDSNRGGLISTMVKKISAIEEWMRQHKSFTHSPLGVVLTGIVFTVSTAVLATDSILVAIGKLQAQLNAIALPSSGSADFGLDFTGKSTLVIANNSTAIPTGANNFSGLMVINETVATGGAAAFITGGGFVVMLGASTGTTHFSTTKDTVGKINVYWDGGTSRITIQNKNGAQITCVVASFRTRQSQ